MSDERRTPRIPPRSAAEAPSASALLDDVLERQRAAAEAPTEPPTRPAGPLIGECVDDRHPVLRGRVRVRIPGDEGEPRWLPTLQGLALRVGDRVLLVRPGNGEEWIVTGVIDGFAARPRIEPTIAARLELRQDEALSIVSADGQPLVELSAGPGGPCVRLLQADVSVELAGKLVLRADDIELEATQGAVSIKSSDDVILRGEVVRLN
ncbi:MAG: hypothetical protein KC420_04870 [Myxococcales bacterium]|nr:hypothetical protein [Myxococcales bacterium]